MVLSWSDPNSYGCPGNSPEYAFVPVSSVDLKRLECYGYYEFAKTLQTCGACKAMTLNEIIQDIHGLDAQLTQLESRYGLLSADFYHLYKAGELEQSRDFIQWVGYYEAKLAREASYREMMYDYLRKLRQRAGLGALHLSPDKPAAPAT